MAGTYNLSCKLKIKKKHFTNYLGAVYLGMNTSYRLIYIRDVGIAFSLNYMISIENFKSYPELITSYYCFLACVNTNYKAPFLQFL